MTLPAPKLDDRRFQDLVDEAKRLVQQRCPEWTDHNVSDPGVTLIECFAQMTDQVLYRLNRVPELHYLKFLELLGVRLFPPTAASVDVTFHLAAPQPATVAIPAGTQVATARNANEPGLGFTTVSHLDIFTTAVAYVGAEHGGSQTFHDDDLAAGRTFSCFSDSPTPGDALVIGLSNPVPSCTLRLALACPLEGVGVDPGYPPVTWEARTATGWSECEVETDSSGGLTRDGQVVLHMPPDHESSTIGGVHGGWVRCRLIEQGLYADGSAQPTYSQSPQIAAVAADTIGGTVQAIHAATVHNEMLGRSNGTPGQRFQLTQHPVVPTTKPMVVEVARGTDASEWDEDQDGPYWEEWIRKDSFAETVDGPDTAANTKIFTLDEASGIVQFGPAVRDALGNIVPHGSIPPEGHLIRVPNYLAGGGSVGNVAAGAIHIVKSSIPFVDGVENRRPAEGGVDGETVDNAKLRGPTLIRTRGRAVTARDYEEIAQRAAPEIGRVHCVDATASDEPNVVRVLVVPATKAEDGLFRFEQLRPLDETLQRIAADIDSRRCVGARVVIEPPDYVPVDVIVRYERVPTADPDETDGLIRRALGLRFNPIEAGPTGSGGWPFGRSPHVGDVYNALAPIRQIRMVDDVRLAAYDLERRRPGPASDRIELGPTQLVYLHEVQLAVDGV